MDNGKGACHYCLKTLSRDPRSNRYATKDHKLPLSKGGRTTADNIVMACRQCNAEKGSHMSYYEFIMLKKPMPEGANSK